MQVWVLDRGAGGAAQRPAGPNRLGVRRWRSIFVKQGPVLMDLQVVDIVMGTGVQPAFTTEDIGTFLTTAVEKFP